MADRSAGRLFGSVHASDQSVRFAVHDADGPRRLRSISRQLDPFPGALARREFPRRAAEGDTDRAMHGGEAGNLGRSDRTTDCRGDAAGVRGDEVGRAGAWRLSTAVPCVSRITAPRLAETS